MKMISRFEHNVIVDLNYDTINCMIDEYNLKKEDSMCPIINQLIDSYNEKVKNRSFTSVWSSHFCPNWYSWKTVNYSYISLQLSYSDKDTILDRYEISRRLLKLLKETYPLANIEVHSGIKETDISTIILYVSLGFREDGLSFVKGY